MKQKLIADSGCDLNKELKEKLGIPLVPLSIRVGENSYSDDEHLDRKKLLIDMKECSSTPQTASPSPMDFMKHYMGEESVFVVTLSSALSSTYSSAIMAKKMFVEQYGDKFIHVFDSLSAASGETVISMKIAELIKANYSNHEIVEKVNEYIKDMKTFFVLESLDNLIKAGRISKFAGKLASVLSINPVMKATEDGNIDVLEKVRGSKKALKRLVEVIGERGERLEEKILGIAHVNCIEKAEMIRDEVKKRYNFKDVMIVEAGGITTIYANDGGIVIAF